MAFGLKMIGQDSWQQIQLPLGRNLALGTGFERALDDAGRKLTKENNSKADVTFHSRGAVTIGEEFGGLTVRGAGKYELMIRLHEPSGVVERCFHFHDSTGESEWTECLTAGAHEPVAT